MAPPPAIPEDGGKEEHGAGLKKLWQTLQCRPKIALGDRRPPLRSLAAKPNRATTLAALAVLELLLQSTERGKRRGRIVAAALFLAAAALLAPIAAVLALAPARLAVALATLAIALTITVSIGALVAAWRPTVRPAFT